MGTLPAGSTVDPATLVSHLHSFMVHLDHEHEDGMHGMHIVDSKTLTGLNAGDTVYVVVDANMASDVVAQVEVLQGSSTTSIKPAISAPHVTHELNNDGTLSMTWAVATAPGISNCTSLEYKVYYHKMTSMHTGMVMGAANVTGHVSLPKNQYLPMLKAIATLGPLAISVDAGKWHDYEEGVFTGGNKTDPQLDHLVQLVGCALTVCGCL